MFGIKCNIINGDEDSSTYKKIIETRPYKNFKVEKLNVEIIYSDIFSINLTSDTSYPLQNRKLLDQNMDLMRKDIKLAMKYTEKKLSSSPNSWTSR